MSFCTLTLSYFCISMLFDPVPNFSGLSIITCITLAIELYTLMALCVCVCVCTPISLCYFDPCIFVLSHGSTLSRTLLNRILWFIDLYPYHPMKLNCLLLSILLCSCSYKLTNLPEFIFYLNHRWQ